MNVEFLAEAEEELTQATLYYEAQQDFLGERFLTTVEDTLTRIAAFPQMFHEIEAGIRQARVPSFPYALIYRIRRNTIQVIAVAHLRRSPGYWHGRNGR
ncbi:MAG: type II toxin-antitoxin system RelE/ParE family toxin [Caldilinea sp. CFX5]|nr:type II toxin-antitoxin system RelE/ParE family toxin [Caldilinea sp. CFX5]